MRIFWIGITLLIIAAAVFLLTGENPSPPAPTDPAARAVADTHPADATAPISAVGEGSRGGPVPAETPAVTEPGAAAEATSVSTNADLPAESSESTPSESLSTPPADPRPAVSADASASPAQPGINMPFPEADPARPSSDPGVPVVPPPAPPAEPIDAEPAEQAPDVSDTAEPADPEPVKAAPAATEPESAQPESAQPESPAAEPVAPELAAPAEPLADPAAGEPAAPTVVQTEHGLLLNNRWNVPGKGTTESPYKIDWDMLVAVQSEYKPRLGQSKIPDWINALNNKTVTIRGYALLPTGMTSTKELLVMLNQWDSCCIGVPPTPYDAIEVRLAEELGPSARSMFSHAGALSFGDITGTLKIDPYIVQGWLLGLYLMEDASASLLGPAGTP